MNRALFLLLLVVGAALCNKVEARSCKSCGGECERACKTVFYRICCLNYVKKRSSSESTLPLAMDPSLRLELWLARTRSPFYQRNYEESIFSNDSDEDIMNTR